MTLDARTAAPEPSLHAATLLSRTRLAQRECAARLGISERTLRYHLTGRPMSYALRCLFERLATHCEMERDCGLYNQCFGRGFRPSALPVFLPHQGNVSDDEARRKVAEWRELHPELVEAAKRFTIADLLDGSKSPTFLTTPTMPDEGTEPFDPTRYRK